MTVRACTFNQTGGNALMLSGGVTNSTIEANEFVHVGDSAVLLLGRTDGIDGTKPTYPNHNYVGYNLMHEIGVYGKQTSCVFHSLAANSTIEGNTCFNGPRAGFNWNDGHGGGSVVRGNLIFNMVRETGIYANLVARPGHGFALQLAATRVYPVPPLHVLFVRTAHRRSILAQSQTLLDPSLPHCPRCLSLCPRARHL